MKFKKDFIVYEKGETRVYINQCNYPGHKTKLFTIRRDDKHGIAKLLGIIKFHGAWRQYVSYFEPGTYWSAGCKKKIVEFEEDLNKKFREKHNRKR